MQPKNKIIISLVSLSFFVTSGLTANATIFTKNNKKFMKNQISSASENKMSKTKNDAISSASKEKHKNTNSLMNNTESKIVSSTFIDKVLNKPATKLVDLGWAKYIVVTFNEGTIKDYDLYVLDGESYKSINASNVDDSGKIVKWEIDKLGYNTIKVKNKKSGEEGIYKFEK